MNAQELQTAIDALTVEKADLVIKRDIATVNAQRAQTRAHIISGRIVSIDNALNALGELKVALPE